MTRAIFGTSSLVHARKRDGSGHVVGRTMCGARTTRTDDDPRVTCLRCQRMLAKARTAVVNRFGDTVTVSGYDPGPTPPIGTGER